MNIVIRKVCVSDIETICGIAVAAWKPIYEIFRENMGDELFNIIHPDWKMEKSQQVRCNAMNYPEQVYVTEKDGKIVGFTSFYINEEKKYGEITNNAVHPEYQGLGIGKLQHNKLLEIFRKKGMKHAMVTTGLDKAHEKARISYEKVGFRPMRSSVTYFQKL